MIRAMVQRVREVMIFLFLALISKASGGGGGGGKAPNIWRREIVPPAQHQAAENAAYCLSWRLGVEANNVRAWRTVPVKCLRYVETYMIGGQYERDVGLILDQITSYANEIVVSDDGLDGWIFDVDDTCISNVFYYRGKRYGCDPYDPSGFKAWAMIGGCPAVPGMLGLFNKLVEMGFKIFLVTGRDEETLGQPTIDNLHNQGFQDYERLIMRTAAYKGQSAVTYKSEIREQLMRQGYRIWGNVGDQWSDLQGECLGNRTFKLPNPMYFVP
ncbi:acid phosphatase 1 isoform X1 [Morus notabilis]|uniref:acid phosphatase 1 isoform X1 n=1 Tax=Morus notabilis TaxID=981085 RepID=UPI000CED2CBF|nr:acid phosphatase 1 isoform X1 [Morus notabilis]